MSSSTISQRLERFIRRTGRREWLLPAMDLQKKHLNAVNATVLRELDEYALLVAQETTALHNTVKTSVTTYAERQRNVARALNDATPMRNVTPIQSGQRASYNSRIANTVKRTVFGRNELRTTNYAELQQGNYKVSRTGLDQYETAKKTENGDKYIEKRYNVQPEYFIAPKWLPYLLYNVQARLVMTAQNPMGVIINPILLLAYTEAASVTTSDDDYNFEKTLDLRRKDKRLRTIERRYNARRRSIRNAEQEILPITRITGAMVLQSRCRRNLQRNIARLWSLHIAGYLTAPLPLQAMPRVKHVALTTHRATSTQQTDVDYTGKTLPTSPRGLARLKAKLAKATK